jgi:PAS domain S-box-containing protein
MNYRDITERKRAEEQLRRSEERFRALVENSHEVVSLFDREGRWLYVSPSVHRIWGYTPEEMLATQSFGERVHPDEVEGVLRKFHALVASPQAVMRVEFRALHKDGSWRDLEAVSVNRLDDPVIGAIVANLRDITERRRADEQRAAILERVSDAFVSLDRDWRYVYVNEKAAQTFGRTPEDLIGKHIWTEFPEGIGQPFYKAYYRAVETQTPVELEEYYPPYGRWFENRIYPSTDGLSIFFRDITERKQAEEKLRRAYAEHRSLTARMETVREEEAARIAREFHDEIGQALTAIKLQLQTLQRRPGTASFSEELGEGLHITEHALEVARNLSQDLRPAVLDDLGLTAALRWYLDRQAQLAGFTAELSALLPSGRLSRDLETACFRVVQEAVTNVARHARARRVRVDLARDGAALLLAIQDDGIGFDVAAAQARARGGQSLGILGMEERVSHLGGSLSIDSSSSEGTRICVRLPFAAAAPAAGSR